MEEKGLRVNTGKTNVMICRTSLDLLQSSCEYECAVYHSVQLTAMAENIGCIRNTACSNVGGIVQYIF